jgi:hypothetical protein
MDSDLATRIDRIESSLAIQQLPIRYALAVDSRNIDAWIGLFRADVDCGRFGTGREALRSFIAPAVSDCYRTVHQICGHEYHFLDPDHAEGHVYCRAEHEMGEAWMVMAICYFDHYVRQDGQWFFTQRRERHWYAVDQREGPKAPFEAWPSHGIPPVLPKIFPSWERYWSQIPDEKVATLTTDPVHGATAKA